MRLPRNKSTKQSDAALMIICVNHEKYIEVPADPEGVHVTLDKGIVGREIVAPDFQLLAQEREVGALEPR